MWKTGPKESDHLSISISISSQNTVKMPVQIVLVEIDHLSPSFALPPFLS